MTAWQRSVLGETIRGCSSRVWPDEEERAQVFEDLRAAPPLVFAGEVDVLRDRVAAAARGEAFLLAGGDCAETFA